MPDKNDTSWGKVAGWYHKTVAKEGSYQRKLILPNILRLASVKKGEKILDFACGEGFFSAEFAKKGAVVWGTDISPELLKIASKRSSSSKFIVTEAGNMSALKESDFDKAFIILSLQNISRASDAIKECSSRLKDEGKLYVVLNHPCFRVPGNSSWGWTDDGRIQHRIVERYLSEMKIPIKMSPGGDPSLETLSFHRPLQYYFKAFEKAGFAVTRMEEWNSPKTSDPGPRALAENRARKEIPLFMAVECRKLTQS